MDLEIEDSDFSFHRDEVTHATKFDPEHLELHKIQLRLSDILMREDTLAGALRLFLFNCPDSNYQIPGQYNLNRNHFVLSKLHLASNANELNADVRGSYGLESTNDKYSANLEVTGLGQINSGDLSYFLSDSLMNHFSHWGVVELGFDGNYANGKVSVQSLNLKTTNSNLHARGFVHDVGNTEKVYWEDIVIDASHRFRPGKDISSIP